MSEEVRLSHEASTAPSVVAAVGTSSVNAVSRLPMDFQIIGSGERFPTIKSSMGFCSDRAVVASRRPSDRCGWRSRGAVNCLQVRIGEVYLVAHLLVGPSAHVEIRAIPGQTLEVFELVHRHQRELGE
jgi:hypothetical protein